MDNNQAFGRNLAGIMIHLQGITSQLNNPDGFTFDPDPEKNEEKKNQFKRIMQDPENVKKLQEMNSGMQKLKDLMKQMNHAAAHKTQ